MRVLLEILEIVGLGFAFVVLMACAMALIAYGIKSLGPKGPPRWWIIQNVRVQK